mgnify:CR=1 FL=1
MYYWIRPASLTTPAKKDEIADLFDKFNSIPFDDRVNRSATINHIRRGYLEDFLLESNSSLVADLDANSLEELLIAAEVWKQVKNVLDYIKTNIIEEKVVKIQNQAEAQRYYNYPYNALEEALVNAVFHKSYQEPEPVEIRIYVDSIQIINYPGLAKWINPEKFAAGKVKARKYRNRRIGELFKEIDLAEKQGTGIPKILRELKKNGSPAPEFEMDDDRTYLITIIHIRDGFKVENKMSDKMSDKEKMFYHLLIQAFENNDFVTTKIMTDFTGMAPSTTRRYLNKFCDLQIIRSDGKNKGTRYYLF